MKCEITFIGHSGILACAQGYALLFDYFQGTLPRAEFAAAEKPVTFISHSHRDHYNPAVLGLKRENPKMQVVVSPDVKCPGAHSIAPGDILELDALVVRAFGSTDLGVSFLVEMGDKRIFHAGDYNLWGWEEESTEEEISQAREDFTKILDALSGIAIDLACFPYDPRMGRNFDEGIMAYCRRIKPRYVVPMHFGDNFACANGFSPPVPNVMSLTPKRVGDKFTITL